MNDTMNIKQFDPDNASALDVAQAQAAERGEGRIYMEPVSAITKIIHEELLPLFKWQHLPPHLQEISRPFGGLANNLATSLPHNRELLKALDRLVEAKDAAVRTLVLKGGA